MASERVQRQIDRLLDEAEAAIREGAWDIARVRAESVLRLDPHNEDARSYLDAALDPPSDRVAGADASPTPAPVPRPLPVSFAAGRYTVHGFLGEGGSKKVYLAHDTRLDRDVALAVVEGLDGDSLERVRREAQEIGRAHV